MIGDGVTAGKEDDDLLLEIALKEGEEKHEPLIRIAYDVALFEHVDR